MSGIHTDKQHSILDFLRELENLDPNRNGIDKEKRAMREYYNEMDDDDKPFWERNRTIKIRQALQKLTEVEVNLLSVSLYRISEELRRLGKGGSK